MTPTINVDPHFIDDDCELKSDDEIGLTSTVTLRKQYMGQQSEYESDGSASKRQLKL